MKHLAAYLLLGLGGNSSPNASDVEAVLSSVGIDADKERLDKLISELEGKDINEVCKHQLASQMDSMEQWPSDAETVDIRRYQ